MPCTIDVIAERAAVDRRSVFRWRLERDFPKPVGHGPKVNQHDNFIYDWAEVRDWLVSTDRWDAAIDAPSGYCPSPNGGSRKKTTR